MVYWTMRQKKINLIYILILIGFCSTVEFCKKPIVKENVNKKQMVRSWKKICGIHSKGKVVFAQPPHMLICYLDSGDVKQIPGIIVEGAPGRRRRGLAPRPFWSQDGKFFIYRYQDKLFVSDEDGNKRQLFNPQMKIGKETRWSLLYHQDRQWAVGPSKNRNIIMVDIDASHKLKTIYAGGDVDNWCEVSANGKYVVFDNGSDVYVVPAFSNAEPIRISSGQSCRPCAAPDGRVAWLPSPHTRYKVHDGKTGKFLYDFHAPPNEEIYRLNWSNHPNYAVHMFGSGGNDKITVRRVQDGKSVFIGHGWDPDLWVGRR